jgi:hypothetical protein
MFGDLHVKAQTLDRCLEVLRRVRELAIKYQAEVICKGDFWDQRGILSVRQLNDIQNELDEHREAGIKWKLIPGNHDQVNQAGTIHGLRVFEGYSNIQVITDPYIDHTTCRAFLPWREDPKEQRELFKTVPAGFTVFGHGEVKGAVANNGHKADGRFEKRDVTHLRAVYLSHYHKRHKVGNVYYTGSPYEQDMGERNMPHGVGYATSETPEPHYFNFDDMKKHWRLTWPQDQELFSAPREQDVVEVLAPKSELMAPAFQTAVALIQAKDVRPLPLSQSAERGAPTFALKIDEAIDRYVDEYDRLPNGLEEDELKTIGHGVLADVADTGTIVPLGSVVHLKQVVVRDFCAVRGEQALPLDALGTVLLRGPMGSGKTAMASDATTWCLYGVTAPRKPGSAGGSIKADKIIHDDAKKAEVEVSLTLDDDPMVYQITRTKARGSGAKLQVLRDGEPWEEVGITDTQHLIHRIMGVDYDLWRTCVSLGQGEVQNFVTDAQKKRTELLERAFNLGACPHAQKVVRKRLKALDVEMEPLSSKLAQVRGRIQQAESVNYEVETQNWERLRKSNIDGATATINAAKVEIAQFDEHLQHESGWQDRKAGLLKKRKHLHDSLAASKPANPGHLHAEIGAAKAEHAQAERDYAALIAKRDALHKSTEAQVCPTCFQALPADQIEGHMQELDSQIATQNSVISTAAIRVQNIQDQLGKLVIDKVDTSGISQQLQEVEEQTDEANKALNAIGQIHVKRQAAVTAWEGASATIKAEQARTNPWKTKAQQQATELLHLKEEEFWDTGFGPKGLPVLVLRTALYELEMHANTFLAKIMQGRIYVELAMHGDDLGINFFEYNDAGEVKARDYENLSGGQRRCVQLAFAPFALGEMIFSRTGVRIPFLVIDELTTHLDPETKPIVCAMIKELGRDTVLVIDHDPQVQGSFDVVYDVGRGGSIRRAA